MLKDLVRRLTAGLVAAALMAVTAGVTVVAAAFGAYAGLKGLVGPAAASGLTALLFAALLGVIAVTAPALVRGRQADKAAHDVHRRHDPATLRTASQAGTALLGLLAEFAQGRRLRRQDKARAAKRRR